MSNQSLLTLENLVSLQYNLTEIACCQIFGSKQLGSHLHLKFLQCNGNIIEFYSRLDVKNKNHISDYLEALIVSQRISNMEK